MFYVVAIVLVMAFPLGVPVTVTVFHAIRNRMRRVSAVRPATSGAVALAAARARQGAVAQAA